MSVVLFLLMVFTVFCLNRFQYDPEPVEASEYEKCESPIERRLYNGLVSYGLHPRTQYNVGVYRIDIAFPGLKIAIECDGKAFHSTASQKAHDRKKDRYLRKNGWKVMRFKGSTIYRNLPSTVKSISREVTKRTDV
ncbi:Very-short-patch-repair endonuclease [Halobacillus dabanensis]|uniref:Very-short-patch-repair endonuclease n=1 Tax=Halobacillus dabanensis TaxID=240302 RepID=A0A1I3WZ85_HALDA|nr:Very-short-patch-repair endonuclease [Halobacillus dabanensis]